MNAYYDMTPSITDVAGRVPQAIAGAAPSANDRRAVMQTVAQVTGSELLGADRELSWSVEPHTKDLIVRVLDRQTKEVLDQFPSAEFLRVAAALSADGEHISGAIGGLPTYA